MKFVYSNTGKCPNCISHVGRCDYPQWPWNTIYQWALPPDHPETPHSPKHEWCRLTLLTAEKRQCRRDRSFKKRGRSSLAMVKTQWRWGTSMILKDIEVVLWMEYMLPQVGQNREWQRKGTYLRLPQDGQEYMAPPKEGSPQLIILVFKNLL